MEKYIDAARLESEVERYLLLHEYDLVDFQLGGRGGRCTYRVYIDNRDGESLTLRDCVKITEPLKLFMESLGAFDDRTSLEVSSPGLDRILKRDKDFERFLGRRVRASFQSREKKKTIVGILSSFTDDEIVVGDQDSGGESDLTLPRRDLIEVRLVAEV